MLKKIGKLVLIFLITLMVLSSLLIIVNSIPKTYIDDNVKQSVQTFINEGDFPKVKFAHNYLLDNYTDALMINTAYSVDPENLLESTILMRRNYRPGENLKLQETGINDKPIQYLIENINGTNETYFEYSRYWHGYMVYLRPLLVVFNYSQIRIIFTIVIIALSMMLIYLTYKKINIYIALATLFMLITSNFWAIGLSLQYSAVYILTLIASIYIIIRNEKITDIASIFFMIGILTSFFDVLTTPLLTLGIPLIFYITLNNKENITNKRIINIVLLWGIGYALMWSAKWIISDLICNTETISNVLGQVKLYTTSVEEVRVNILQVIMSNLSYVLETIAFLVFTTIISYFMSYKKVDFKNIKRFYLLIAMIGILPFLWFAIVKNHSYIHARFTFRNLMLTIFTFSIITMNNIKNFIESSKNENK